MSAGEQGQAGVLGHSLDRWRAQIADGDPQQRDHGPAGIAPGGPPVPDDQGHHGHCERRATDRDGDDAVQFSAELNHGSSAGWPGRLGPQPLVRGFQKNIEAKLWPTFQAVVRGDHPRLEP